MNDVENLWDLAAGQRCSLASELDDLLQLLAADADLRAAANLEAMSQLRDSLRAIPATVGPGEPVAIPAQAAVLLTRLLLARFR